MNLNDIDFSKIPDIAEGKALPGSVLIKQMEKDAENERYEKLENRIGNIEEYSKSQAKLAEDEIFFLKQQLELALQRAVDAETGERKANRIAIISVSTTILSLLVNVAMLIISLMP